MVIKSERLVQRGQTRYSSWIKLGGTKYIIHNSVPNTDWIKNPSMIISTDFIGVFEYGNEPLVTSFGGGAFREIFPGCFEEFV